MKIRAGNLPSPRSRSSLAHPRQAGEDGGEGWRVVPLVSSERSLVRRLRPSCEYQDGRAVARAGFALRAGSSTSGTAVACCGANCLMRLASKPSS